MMVGSCRCLMERPACGWSAVRCRSALLVRFFLQSGKSANGLALPASMGGPFGAWAHRPATALLGGRGAVAVRRGVHLAGLPGLYVAGLRGAHAALLHCPGFGLWLVGRLRRARSGSFKRPNRTVSYSAAPRIPPKRFAYGTYCRPSLHAAN